MSLIPPKILLVVISTVIFLSFFAPRQVLAFDFLEDSGITDTGNEAGYDVLETPYGEEILIEKIGKIIRAILSFLGVIFLVLMIYGGYTWMLARGNEQEVSKARSIIINSIIGLIIIMAAWAVTYFAGVLWSHMSAR